MFKLVQTKPNKNISPYLFVFFLIIFLLLPFFFSTATPFSEASYPELSPDDIGPLVRLTAEESNYLKSLGTITMAVDPDWQPYELVDVKGIFTGIAADLDALVFGRLGMEVVIVDNLRMAELKEEPMLQNIILNKGIATITPAKIQNIINSHVNIKGEEEQMDYRLIIIILIAGLIIILFFVFRNRQLQKNNRERSFLLDNIPLQIWYIKNEETYGVVNKAFAAYLGKTVKDVSFKKIADILPKERVKKTIIRNREVIIFGQKKSFEETIKNYQGEERLFHIVKTPIFRADGSVEYIVCTAEDITERKAMEIEMLTAKQ